MDIKLDALSFALVALAVPAAAGAFQPEAAPIAPSSVEMMAPGFSVGTVGRLSRARPSRTGFLEASFAADGAKLSALVGRLSEPRTASPSDVAVAFAAATFPGRTLEVASVLSDGEQSHVRFRQRVGGVEVFATGLDVHVARDGQVTMANGTVVDEKAPLNGRKLTADEARQMASKRVSGPNFAAAASPATAVLFPAVEGLRHAWACEVRAPFSRWTVVVDAQSGDVLYSFDEVRRFDGRGRVYLRDPGRGRPVLRTLPDLTGPEKLAGTFANVDNALARRAASTDGKFVFAPANTHFDEVNVYYHVNLVHDFFEKRLGFTGLDKPMRVHVHVPDPDTGKGHYDNAFFNPGDGTLNFGDGNRLNDFSRDASVIYHEYTHAVTDAIAGQLVGGEGGGLHEGYSDYFAAALTGDPDIGTYIAARLSNPHARNVDNRKHYPEDARSEPHEAGSVWAGACWALRKAVGAEVADLLVHRSRYYLPRFQPSFADACRGILEADRTRFHSAHTRQLTEVFARRGLATSADAAVSGADLSRVLSFREQARRMGEAE